MTYVKLGSTTDDMAQGLKALLDAGLEVESVEFRAGTWIAEVRS